MPFAVGGDYRNEVDIFNVATGTWSTAALSQARGNLAATSLPNAGVAIFAGGKCMPCGFCLRCCRMDVGVRGMREMVECCCADDVSMSYALCSSRWSK
jgi:hypothetical protein